MKTTSILLLYCLLCSFSGSVQHTLLLSTSNNAPDVVSVSTNIPVDIKAQGSLPTNLLDAHLLPQQEDKPSNCTPILLDGKDFHSFKIYEIRWTTVKMEAPIITGDDKRIEWVKVTLVKNFRPVVEVGPHVSIAKIKADERFKFVFMASHSGDVLMFEVKLRQVKDPMFYQIVVASYETNLKRK